MGTSTQVGYIADISGIKANADKPNQLDIPQNTVGFFEVQVSDDAANKSSKILLAAGRIAMPDAAIAMQSTTAAGITVDTTNKTVLVRKESAGTKFTVGGLNETKFADGVPKYVLTYSAEGMGPDKLAQAINRTTGEVTLGSAADRAEIAIKVSGKEQGPYKARAATTLYRLTFKPYTTTVSGKVVTPARFQDATNTKGSVISTAEVWANPANKVNVKADGSYELEVANHPGTFTLTANYTETDGKYKQSDPQTVTTTSTTHSLNIPLKYGRTGTVNGSVAIFPRGKSNPGGTAPGVKIIVEVEGVQVAAGVTDSFGNYKFENVPHNGTLTIKTGYTGTDVKNKSESYTNVADGSLTGRNFLLVP